MHRSRADPGRGRYPQRSLPLPGAVLSPRKLEEGAERLTTTRVRLGPGGLDGEGAIGSVADGAITPRELYEDAALRADDWEPRLGALTQQIEFAPLVRGPLEGMVLGVKNQIDVSGYLNWWSLQGGGRNASPAIEDATVVARLRQAGASLLCTTAAPSVGAPGGLTPETVNPRSTDRVSGGSSGGSAAAVAAGMVHGALGSDSGGSIRIPAACCGVVGLQTTRGLVPLTGTGGLTYSIGNVGPLASTTADVRHILGAISGFDPIDPYSVEPPAMDRWDGNPLRIGIPTELMDWNLDPEVREMLEAVVKKFTHSGHSVDRISVPVLRDSMELGPKILGIAESGAIIEDRLGAMAYDRPELFKSVRRSKEISGPTLARANHQVAVLRSEVDQVFTDYDFLVMPTLPCRIPDGSSGANEEDIEVGGVMEPRTSALTRLVNPWNLAALPAGSLPVTRDSGGAPISVQIVGGAFSDWRVLDVMEFVEGAFGGPWDTVAPS